MITKAVTRPTPYQLRVLEQTRRWVQGNPIHNVYDNECCPDFSCCLPDYFEKDKHTRELVYVKLQQQYGVIQ